MYGIGYEKEQPPEPAHLKHSSIQRYEHLMMAIYNEYVVIKNFLKVEKPF
jgi:hypothetical protein